MFGKSSEYTNCPIRKIFSGNNTPFGLSKHLKQKINDIIYKNFSTYN